MNMIFYWVLSNRHVFSCCFSLYFYSGFFLGKKKNTLKHRFWGFNEFFEENWKRKRHLMRWKEDFELWLSLGEFELDFETHSFKNFYKFFSRTHKFVVLESKWSKASNSWRFPGSLTIFHVILSNFQTKKQNSNRNVNFHKPKNRFSSTTIT